MMRKERNRKRGGFWKVLLTVLLVAAAWFAAFLGIRTMIRRMAAKDTFLGRYDIDGYTVYVFENGSRGAMELGGDKRYSFTYTMADGALTLDFDDASVTDAVFAYQLEGDTLTLAEGDEVFVLKKQ